MHEVAPPLSNGRYRLLDILGSGGMATVYRAWDSRLEVVRAIKVLAPKLAANASLRSRFEAEARTMARLHHRNLVTVHDVDAEGDRVFMVMELVQGGSLMDLVEHRGRLGEAESLVLLDQVLQGLRAAHDEGVVHRDIKPHNVLLAVDGTPKITDFGIARVADSDHTRTGAVMGTWAYMAPEQRVDARSVDGRADLFAVGATLYVMVTGREPYDLYSADLEEEVFEGVQPGVAQLIKGATRYKPEHRYPSAEEMLSTLHGLRDTLDPERLASLPSPAVEPGPLPDLSGISQPVISHAPSDPTFAMDLGEGSTLAPSEDEPTRRSPLAFLAAGGVAFLGTAMVIAALVVLLGGGALFMAFSTGSAEAPPDDLPEPIMASTPDAPAPPEEVVEAAPEEPPPTQLATPTTTTTPTPRPARPAATAAPAAPVPPPTPTGTVQLTGEASEAWLERHGQRVTLPGPVPAGAWAVHARFGEAEPVLTGQITVLEGETVKLNCKAGFMRCAVE